MNLFPVRYVLITLFLFSLQINCYPDITVARIFNSNMVLQQGQENLIWGWADTNEKITLTINGNILKTRAGKDGTWKIKLPVMNYGGPYKMRIKGQNTIDFTNIMVGEVWVCSGQSNMEWPVSRANNADKEIINADYPNIRLFKVSKKTAQIPEDNLDDGTWEICTPETVSSFSAVGYFFGREIHQKREVAIGLIQSAWGGTVAETWISGETIKDDPDFSPELEELLAFDLEAHAENERKRITRILGEYPLKDQGENNNFHLNSYKDDNWKTIKVPGDWESQGYNKIDGVIWYRTQFELSDEQAGSRMELSLSTVDDVGRFWINGKLVGNNEHYDTNVSFLVPEKVLKPGKNVLVARVLDTGGPGGIYGEGVALKGKNTEVNLSGNWKFKFTEVRDNTQSVNPNSYPTLLYNGMIHPIVPYGIKGVIWYQGESNSGRPQQYQRIFPNLIKDWRTRWDIGDFPFLWVQLANYMEPDYEPAESNWAELREAQTLTLSLPNTAQALAIDIGEADDIHPRNKQDVGKRLAIAAQNVAYQKDVVYSGPVFKSMRVESDKVHIEFDHIGSGLKLDDKYGYVKGFAVAGEDGKFYWARGYKDGNTIVLSSDQVDNPKHVRYAWGDNPYDANLYNAEGLPAVPFRTDVK